MNELLVFVWIASAITLAANQVKALINASVELIFPALSHVKWGIFISLAFSFWAVFSYQTGLLYNIGLEYTNPCFKSFDLTITSFITAGGAALVYQWLETVKSSYKKVKDGER